MELGEAAMYVNPLMSAAVDHPYITGVITGTLAGLGLVLTGVIAGTAPWSLGSITTGSTVASITTAQLAQKIGDLSKLEQIPKATAKLNDVSRVIGQSVDEILKIASKSETIFGDLRHSGNVNIFIKNPVNSEKLVRVTLDPSLIRIISAGFDRIKQVEQWVANGDFIKLTK